MGIEGQFIRPAAVGGRGLKNLLSRELEQLGVFGFFPNLLLALCTLGLSVPRPWVNLDLLVFGIVALFLPRILAIAGFATLMALELVIDVAPIFHFDPVAFLHASADAKNLNWSLHLLPASFWLAFPTGLAVLSVCLWRVTKRKSRSVAVSLLVAILVVTSLDVANGTNSLNGKILYLDGSFAPVNFAFSPLERIATGIVADRYNQNSMRQWVPTDSALARALTLAPHAGPRPRNNIALVIVESWGTMTAMPGMDDYLLKPLLNPALQARYDIVRGAVPYHGSTTAAEIRELCGVAGSYRMLQKNDIPSCWPGRLTQQGYHVVGIHGFWSTMFDRVGWWPLTGISRALFMGDPGWQAGRRRCGTSFRGICDDDAVAELGNQLQKGPGVFAYLLTLNSHLPVAQDLPARYRFDCAVAPAQLSPKQCAIAASWRVVFDAVAKQAARDDIGHTTFVVVGDHPPPFFYKANSAAFSHDVVPFIILVPRQQP